MPAVLQRQVEPESMKVKPGLLYSTHTLRQYRQYMCFGRAWSGGT